MSVRSWLAWWIVVAAGIGPAAGQDMSVYTTVSRVGKSSAKPEVIGRSLTLFHAGKVYDYMEDVGEVVILEPINNRFVILGSNYLASRVDQAELQQFLKVARREAEAYLHELQTGNDRRGQRVAVLLEFQLGPKFQEEYEPTLQRLKLAAAPMTYEVKTARIDSPQLTEQYLTYADWAARLNSVLHPQAMYPDPRLMLNASLRGKGLLPTAVDLRTRADGEAHLKAEHKFGWELQASDKAHINKWERLLESDRVRWVSFHEYQKQLLAGLDRGGRPAKIDKRVSKAESP